MRKLIPGLAPGASYNVQFRARSIDKVSEWSRSFVIDANVDSVPPRTPTGFTGEVTGTSFLLHWNQVTESEDGSLATDTDHYSIKMEGDGVTAFKSVKYDQGKGAGDVISALLTLSDNRASFSSPQASITFSVQAVDKYGNASAFTPEVSLSNPPPSRPTDFVVTGGIETIYGSWTPPSDNDLSGYRVHMGLTPAFVAEATNLVYQGSVPQFSIPSDAFNTDLYFKLYAVDVFGSLSSPSVDVGPVRIRTTTGGDVDAPDAPTGVTATITTAPDLSTSAKVEWTPPANPTGDLAGYTVEYRKAGATDWAVVSADGDATSITINNLTPYTDYEFRVRAYDYSFNYSAWTATVLGGGAVNTAPSTPAAPSVAGNPQSIQIVHGLKKVDGTALESDVVALKFYVGDTAGFTANDSTLIGQVDVDSSPVVVATYPVPVVSGSEDRWVKVVAVDAGGLTSPASAAATVTVKLIDWAAVTNVTVTNAQIENVDANKITAGTSFTNDLNVKSTFTLGDSTTDGVIKSFGYTAGVSGFKLAKSGLEINEGSIAAKALKIQFGNNLMHPAYADFEWAPTFYTTGLFLTGATATVVAGGAKYNQQYLSIRTTGAASGEAFFGSTATNYNVDVEASTDYIVSAWVKAGAVATSAQLRLYYNNGTSAQTAAVSLVANGTWQRISQSITVPAGVSKVLISAYVNTSLVNAGFDIDGIQIEKKLAGVISPSTWAPPSSTTIDGGQIRTGEIRSTANVTVNGVAQPAWLINTSGGAQFGDVLIRGSMIVGTLTDGSASKVQSANYVASTAGWLIRSDGYAEFSNLAVYGGFFSTGKVGEARMVLQNSTDTSGSINSMIRLYSGRTLEANPGEIKSQSNGPLTTDGWFLSLRPPQVADPNTTGFVYPRPTIYMFAGDPDSASSLVLKAGADVVSDYGGITLTATYDAQNGYHTDASINAFLYVNKSILLLDGDVSKIRGVPFANLWVTNAWSTASGAGQQPVPLNSGIFNNLTVNYNTQKITITKTGMYLLTLQANIDDPSYTGYITGLWRRNGTEVLAATRVPLTGSGYASGTSVCALNLAAGEYVWPFVTRPGDTNWRGGSTETYATVTYLGSA